MFFPLTHLFFNYTQVHSDMWRGYMNLPLHVPQVIQHDTVNHTFHFVDPLTGAHTQVSKTWLSSFNASKQGQKW